MILTAEDGTSRTKTDPISSFFTTSPTYTGLDLNPGLRGERLVYNRLIQIGSKSDLHSERLGPLRTFRLHQILYKRCNITTILCGEMCI
jgi:hypothetical protein